MLLAQPAQRVNCHLRAFGEALQINRTGTDPVLGGVWFDPFLDLSFFPAWPVKPAARYPSKVAKERKHGTQRNRASGAQSYE